MNRGALVTILALAALLLLGPPPTAAATPPGADGDPAGTVRGFRLEAPDLAPILRPGSRGDSEDATTATGGLPLDLAASENPMPPGSATQQAVQRDEPPPRDKVGGFQFSLLGGVQLVGSASGQGGVVLGWFKPSTAAVGIEAEAGITLGPNGEVYHGLLSIVLQSGARSSKIVPYVTVGGGVFRAEVNLRDAVEEELPNFGIDLPDSEEQGALIAVGLGVRYYLNDWLSLRFDYREFRALTEADGSFLDRLFALRRIGGMLALEF